MRIKFTHTALTVAVCLLLSGSLSAQSIREQVLNPVTHSAGSSMAYEYLPSQQTPAPQGYVPFYINHLGRHGSRNHTSDNLFTSLVSALKSANEKGNLTAKGEDLMKKLVTVDKYMYKRYGDITHRGKLEHKQIAQRMYTSYPQVFDTADGKQCDVVAKSTLSPRCVLSMSSFCMELLRLNSALDIDLESSDRNNSYMNYYNKEYRNYYDEGPWKAIYNDFRSQSLNPERLVASLFKGKAPSRVSDDPLRFMTNLFSAAAIMQDTDLDISLYDVFSDDEIFMLWQVQNLNQYLRKGPSAVGGELALAIAKPLLKNFMETSQAAIDGNGISANLRFAHGEQIMPFTALIGIEGVANVEADPARVYEAWNDFKISPMAANVQWIFFRNASKDVIVKVLLNEKEVTFPIKSTIAPFYKWKDLSKYFAQIVK